MEPPTYQLNLILSILRSSLTATDFITISVCVALILILIIMSGIISSSENAFFSLTKVQIEDLTGENGTSQDTIRYLLSNPKKLLATVLIANTFVNICIVMVSSLLFNILFDFSEQPILGFTIQIVLVTFIIVLFGEVIPKIYAAQNNTSITRWIAIPMYFLSRLLSPFVWILVKSTSVIDKRITKKGHVLSVHELTHAIDITSESDSSDHEKTILKSIVNFGNINVKQIMRQRPDMYTLDQTLSFHEVLNKINSIGYSRMPVYLESLDNITGILYIKDLLPYIDKKDEFKWNSLIRKPYFVPESKKIDNLLKEFQKKRVHMAIVVDEYGGTCGLVTMEDILEEIFGEINDEFDEDEHFYSRVNDITYIFEAKIPIHDMCKFMGVDSNFFDEVSNEADTLGGLLLEQTEELPQRGEQLEYDRFTFIIEAVDKRKIKRVKVILNLHQKEHEN